MFLEDRSTVESVEVDRVDFDLLYEGPLPSEPWDPRKADRLVPYKQSMRSCFHAQLQRLLVTKHLKKPKMAHRCKGRMSGQRLIPVSGSKPDEQPPPNYKIIAPYLSLGGQNYVPLFTQAHGVICDLRITILSRRETTKRDTDNRIKVLHDALRIPHTEKEVEGQPAQHDDCLCLLEDDGSLIGEETTVTRELLKQIPASEDYVVVWIYASIKKADPSGSI